MGRFFFGCLEGKKLRAACFIIISMEAKKVGAGERPY
jgi:hypothetical protein